jgi:hypothetical protein
MNVHESGKLDDQTRLLAIEMRDTADALPKQPQGTSVPMPTNEDQAALMALIGTRWLGDNAPHRLKSQDAQHDR